MATVLFSLEPIGVGTATVESLTSYLARLAEAHSVTVGTLVGEVIAEELGKEYLLRSSKHGGSRFYEQASALNGSGKQAADLSSALLRLTGCDVSPLTLQSWRTILPATKLLRNKKAWCPICLENWKQNQQLIYEPLIWYFKLSNICILHNVVLNTRCPLCESEIPVLSRKSRNGYCSYCGCWLGSPKAYTPKTESSNFLWYHFVVSNIADLLINIPHLPSNYFEEFIGNLMKAAGGLNAFSRHFNIAKSMVSEWSKGLHKPSLDTILKICYSLGQNVLEQQTSLENKPLKCISDEKKSARRLLNWDNVKAILEKIIDNSSDYAPSVNEVAKELQINKRSLYYHFPELCRDISKNHSQHIQLMKSKRIEDGCKKIKEAVENAYQAGEYPSRRVIENFLPSAIILKEEVFKEYWKTLNQQ